MNDNSINSSIRDNNETNKKKINRIFETNRRGSNHDVGTDNNSSSTKTPTSSGNSSTLQFMNDASERNPKQPQNKLAMSSNNNNKKSSTILIQKLVFYFGIAMIINSLILSLRHHGSVLRVMEHQHTKQNEHEKMDVYPLARSKCFCQCANQTKLYRRPDPHP